ncbi:MAG TPA: hypothetical protein VNG31_07515, partial [Candidatus Baltobacteraceae bacterium]|nr:hypothetical protein [Candidatus Baltobacteraceae bacterium]
MKRTAWSTGVVVLCLAVPAMASAQSPAPPKQIIEVKTRELCTTLRESIAPTLVGLIKNYQAIDASRNAVAAAAADANDPHSQMARLYIENTVSAIVHNLAVIDHFLADTKHFPLDPTNDDERAAAKVKARLAAVEANQRMLLNGIYATAETAGMADMGHVFPVGTVVEGPRSEVM